ncbi:MAG: hypothetical protein NTU60_09915 [Candidatus Aminicenantes bacterium]|nr:hypothetical protein [Candidatus Aminicenantes bacterium]
MSPVTYKCGVCDHQLTVEKGQAVPVCCKKEMEPMPFCTAVPTAEMARNYAEDEPCLDGTARRQKK